MPKTKKFIFILSFIFLLITLPGIVNADALDHNKTTIALNQSRIDLQEMIDAGFNVLRVNDTLSQAEQLFNAQYALQISGGTPDYSLILERTEKITELRKQAEEISDELKALGARLNNVNAESEAFSIFNEAKEEFADERYDMVIDLVEEAYTKIGEEQALKTRFRAIYVASTKTVFDFFEKRWKEIISIITIIILVYLLFRKKVAILLINKKIVNLSFEKEVLGKLIKKSQYEYFHLFKIPEELYHIRIEKFGELIRSIDRQIPILLEEKERIKGTTKEEVKSKRFIFNKKIIIIAISVFILIVAGIFSVIFFKLIYYSQILEFIQNIGLNTTQAIDHIYYSYGILGLITAVIIALLFLSAIFVYIYGLSKSKEEKEKPVIEKEKKFRFFNPLKVYISKIIDRLRQQIKRLIERFQQTREYRKLLKQKREEELPRIRYLRKQRIILFKRNLQQKIHSILSFMDFSRTDKNKLEDNEMITEKVKKKKIRKKNKNIEKNLQKSRP